MQNSDSSLGIGPRDIQVSEKPTSIGHRSQQHQRLNASRKNDGVPPTKLQQPIPWKNDPKKMDGPGSSLVWVYLKMLCSPLYPMVLLILIPMKNGYFIGNIPYVQTNPYHLSNDTTHGLWRGVSRLTLFKKMGKRTHDRRQQAICVAHVAFELYTSFSRESHLIPQVRDVCLLEYPDEQNSSRNQMWTAKDED